MANIKHTGRCPICNSEIKNDSFYCSPKCALKGWRRGIRAQTTPTRPKKIRTTFKNGG